MERISDIFRMMVEQEASDVFFSPGTPLHIKIEGAISPVSPEPLSAESVAQLADGFLSEQQREAFAKRPEMNIGLEMEGLGRFRVNIFRQRGKISIVVRYLKDLIPTIEQLQLPQSLKELVMSPRGLVLLVGATGAGKSTTLASMIEYRSANNCDHILTIEEPIEYIHGFKRSIINQREVGLDTLSYEDALKNAMREAPNVILIGEIRDGDIMKHALAYAETGHLCLSTLHASNSSHALERVISFFPQTMHQQIFLDLAHNLAAVVSQRLVTGVDGKRLPAVEVMLITPLIRDQIRKGAIDEIRDAMEKSSEPGMQTFDQALFHLYKEAKITAEEALTHAESVSNLNVMIRLDKKDFL
jgi:twitching motility protein PilU